MIANWLILETSGRVARVGLARGNELRLAPELDTARRHARELVPTIEALMKSAALQPTDLSGVMVSCGPGSYTGLRVGLATAKALAYAVGRELRAVDTFAAIAEQSPAEALALTVLADALQGQVYSQRFVRQPEGWSPVEELRIAAIASIGAEMPLGDWVSGPGVSVYDRDLPAANPRVREEAREARVASVLAVGLRVAPLSRERLFTLEPLYLRGSSAEEKANAGKGAANP
jgi:tRNA threonylcarbamoyladenosine biosynthesis protein TsaB